MTLEERARALLTTILSGHTANWHEDMKAVLAAFEEVRREGRDEGVRDAFSSGETWQEVAKRAETEAAELRQRVEAYEKVEALWAKDFDAATVPNEAEKIHDAGRREGLLRAVRALTGTWGTRQVEVLQALQREADDRG